MSARVQCTCIRLVSVAALKRGASQRTLDEPALSSGNADDRGSSASSDGVVELQKVLCKFVKRCASVRRTHGVVVTVDDLTVLGVDQDPAEARSGSSEDSVGKSDSGEAASETGIGWEGEDGQHGRFACDESERLGCTSARIQRRAPSWRECS